MTHKEAKNLAKMIMSMHVSNLKCFSDLYLIAAQWAKHAELDDYVIDYYQDTGEELDRNATRMAELYILDKALEDDIL